MSLFPAPHPVRCDPQTMRLRYKYIPIGEGTFGVVYMALVTNERCLRPVALKQVHITNHVKYPPLLHEAAALLRVRAHRSIPEVYGWGRSQFFEYLSLELLGPDLCTWFILMEKPLSSWNLTAIVWQMLDVLEYVHSQGVIHCDIKPPNIMLGRGDNKSHVFLCDFGLSLPFDPDNLLSEPTIRQRGSGYYMSLNNHLHGALSPHDDMESLAYTILELQIGRLPWEDCMSHTDVFLSKRRWTGEHWTATTGCPKAFGDFLDAVRDRGQVLDYARWKRELCGKSTTPPPDAESPYKCDPLDDAAPIRRTIYDDSEFHMPLTAAELAQIPKSPVLWSSVSGSSHGFNQWSTWAGPVTVEEAATFGDERGLVLQGLALIGRPPTCGASLRAPNPWEVMRRFSDILDENVGGTVGGDQESDSGKNGSEPVDGGYGSNKDEGSDNDQVEVTKVMHEMGAVSSVFDDSDFRQFYDPEYGRM
ncbi:hypothetical protein V8D89_009128 [Ganoderma adspersum]